MKAGPVLAMVALIFVGMWMVLQPTLSREAYDFELEVGAVELRANFTDSGAVFVAPARLADRGEMSPEAFLAAVREERRAWNARPELEQTLLGFFNITSWVNFGWVAVGLGGQLAFFGRMMAQWVTSENKRQSVVPEVFWWLSLVGGACLFTYFVWRVDFVGVLGQSTGVVVYARNLRLIKKQKRRARRDAAREAEKTTTDTPESPENPVVVVKEGEAHAGAAG